ncbi:MAG: XRE family transcriptional regulator [Alphaproteobacteria bacterium]|nr:MAG: XRE family transcriptional regulator [Alphaproteobacteria bacterium]
MLDPLTRRLAARLKELRTEKGWSLDQLAEASGVSRATLSRLEKAEVSPTTEVLGKLCVAYSMSLTRLLAAIEEQFTAHIPAKAQSLFEDKGKGFARRAISPPAASLKGEVLECDLAPGSFISYEAPPVSGQEHHLVLLDGELDLRIGETDYHLSAGDCLRYQLYEPSEFRSDPEKGARYLLVLI